MGPGRCKRGCGNFWWSTKVRDQHLRSARVQGRNLIVLVPDQDMVIVTTADNLVGLFGYEAREKEGVEIDMVGKFIKSLPVD